jgi:DNA sulfur modification protein DndE
LSFRRFRLASVSVSDFGAIGDGNFVNTIAFATAIEACAKAGGGRVCHTSGDLAHWSDSMKSNINLHLERGAVIQFSRRIDDYRWCAQRGKASCRPENVADLCCAVGEYRNHRRGRIRRRRGCWRMVKKSKLTENEWKKL